MSISPELIADLYSEYEGVPVLSLVLPLEKGGIAARRLRIEALLDEVHEGLGREDEASMKALGLAADRIATDLAKRDETTAVGTWIVFATAERVFFSHVLTESLPALARFGQGPRVAPLVGLPELRGRGVVALVDSERARLFKAGGAGLEEVVALIADRQIADLSDVGMAKRAGTTSGVRGQPGKDRAERALSAELNRFARHVGEEAARLEGQGSFFIVGGAVRMTVALRAELPSTVPVVEVSGLTVEMNPSALEQAIRQPLAAFHQGAVNQVLDRIENSVGVQGQGCLGWNDTLRALMAGAVQTLVISRRLIEEYPDRGEEIVRMGMGQGGSIEVATGEAGETLFEANDGVGALLRFVVPAVAESVAS